MMVLGLGLYILLGTPSHQLFMTSAPLIHQFLCVFSFYHVEVERSGEQQCGVLVKFKLSNCICKYSAL